MTHHHHRLRAALRATAATLIAVATPAAAWAQSEPAGVGSEPGDVIIVTGSRIARPELEANVPIAVVGQEELRQDAALNIQDTLNELPQLGVSDFSRTNSNFLTSGNGVAAIDLRNLGSERTLVLVNGRRFVAGIAGTSIVDINNIPTDFVERVEVVTGGASAVYGSEAIAGVVNFILKDKFDGISIRGQYGLTEKGDNPRYLISVTGGTTWGPDDRGTIIANFSYDDDKGLPSRKRNRSSQDCSNLGCGPQSYSSYAAQGRFDLQQADFDNADADPSILTDANGEPTSLFTFNPDNSLVAGFPVGYGFNRNGRRLLSVPVERYLGTAILNYEVMDNVNLFAEVTYSKVKSSARIEAFPLDAEDIYFDESTGFGIPLTNPFIPAPIQAAIAAANSDADPNNDVGSIAFRRRQNEVFDRSNVVDRDTWRVATGVKGDISDKWNYEVSYVFGQVKDFTGSEDIDNARYRQALDSIVDPATGQIVCRDPAARAQGCAPINLFGYNTASPEASSYVQAVVPKSENIKNTEHVVSASISGSVLTLPAGDLGIAVGGEYRKEKAVDDLDILTNTGGNSGNQIPDFSGEFDVWEAFGEVNVPILADRPFFNYLGATASARYSDYSTVGGVFSWAAGGEWSPLEGIRFRGTYAEANRAPNIFELVQPPSEDFPTGLTDPCDGVTAATPGPVADACRAIPSVAAAIASDGALTYTLADYQGINGFDTGNPDLEEETAKTFTIGGVLTPRALPGFSLSVDYFNIKVDNAINQLSRQFSITQCVVTSDPDYCSLVFRDANTGLIDQVDAPLFNIANFKTSGIDVEARYVTAPGFLPDDRVNFSVNYTYLIKLEKTSFPGAPVEENRGQLDGEGRLGAGFKHRATGRAGYGFGPFTFSWQLTYFGKIQDTLDFVPPPGTPADVADNNNVGARWYHDIQLRYDVGEERQYSFYLGVDNLFDEQPPTLPSPPFASTITGAETAADTYDPYGRRFYVGAQVKF